MSKKSDPTITLSIEPMEGKSYQHGYHLGTQLELAKQIAVDRFNVLNKSGNPTRTVALIRGGKIVDCYDGRWSSDYSVEA